MVFLYNHLQVYYQFFNLYFQNGRHNIIFSGNRAKSHMSAFFYARGTVVPHRTERVSSNWRWSIIL